MVAVAPPDPVKAADIVHAVHGTFIDAFINIGGIGVGPCSTNKADKASGTIGCVGNSVRVFTLNQACSTFAIRHNASGNTSNANSIAGNGSFVNAFVDFRMTDPFIVFFVQRTNNTANKATGSRDITGIRTLVNFIAWDLCSYNASSAG